MAKAAKLTIERYHGLVRAGYSRDQSLGIPHLSPFAKRKEIQRCHSLVFLRRSTTFIPSISVFFFKAQTIQTAILLVIRYIVAYSRRGKKGHTSNIARGMWGKAESWFVSSFPGLMRIQEDRHASRRKGNRVRNSMSPSKSRVEQNVRWC